MEKEAKKTEVAVEVLDKDGEVIKNEYTVVFNNADRTEHRTELVMEHKIVQNLHRGEI